jgi:hypothetical protein
VAAIPIDFIYLYNLVFAQIKFDGSQTFHLISTTPWGMCHWCPLSKMQGRGTEPVSTLQCKENFIAPLDSN